MGQQIKHYVLYEKEIPIHFLEVSISDKQVLIYGVVNAQSLIEATVSFAGEIASGYSVVSEIQVIQDYTVVP